MGQHRPKKKRQHGTNTGYTQHMEAKDAPCGPCKEARREYRRTERYQKRTWHTDKTPSYYSLEKYRALEFTYKEGKLWLDGPWFEYIAISNEMLTLGPFSMISPTEIKIDVWNGRCNYKITHSDNHTLYAEIQRQTVVPYFDLMEERSTYE